MGRYRGDPAPAIQFKDESIVQLDLDWRARIDFKIRKSKIGKLFVSGPILITEKGMTATIPEVKRAIEEYFAVTTPFPLSPSLLTFENGDEEIMTWLLVVLFFLLAFLWGG